MIKILLRTKKIKIIIISKFRRNLKFNQIYIKKQKQKLRHVRGGCAFRATRAMPPNIKKYHFI